MTTVRKSYANEIEKYLKAHPYKNVLVQNMFDDLGLYSTRPSGKRAYNMGGFPVRQVLYGLTSSKSGQREPMEGLEILTDLADAPGTRGTGIAWTKVWLRYTPPMVAPAPAPSPVEAASADEDVEWVPLKCTADFSDVVSGLAALRAEAKTTNSLLERLLAAWGEANPSPSEADLAQWAEADEQVDKA